VQSRITFQASGRQASAPSWKKSLIEQVKTRCRSPFSAALRSKANACLQVPSLVRTGPLKGSLPPRRMMGPM
jgi:hypothetical protein